MNFADRIKETTTTTGTGALTLGGAATGFRPFSPAIANGSQIPYGVSDALGNWEVGYGSLTNATTLARSTVLASSNANALVNFPAGSKDVFLTLPAALIAAFQVSQDIAFAAAVPLTVAGTQYMPPQTVAGVIAFTVAASPVKGASVYVRLIADGTNAPTFSGMKEWGGSLGYDNRSGIANQIQFFYDGVDVFYSISQAVGAVAVDNTAPTASSAAVANGTPTVVALTLSEAMDTNYVPAAAAFTVGGHTVSSVAFASATVLNLTVSAAFVNGEAARTAAYTQPGTNNLRDVAGNLLASFAGLAITNNVAPAAGAIRLSPRSSDLTESASAPWTYSGGSGSYSGSIGGVATQALQAGVDGSLSMKFSAFMPSEMMLSVQTANTVQSFFSQPCSFYTQGSSGKYQAFSNGSGVGPNTVDVAVGDIMRMRRTGSSGAANTATIIGEVSKDGGATWSTVYTWTNQPTGVLYFQAAIGSGGSSSITNLVGVGLA